MSMKVNWYGRLWAGWWVFFRLADMEELVEQNTLFVKLSWLNQLECGEACDAPERFDVEMSDVNKEGKGERR